MKVSSVKLTNFKSYYGVHSFENFCKFTSVIGLNASGKSNLLDALCFVLGAKTRYLRCSDVSELISKGCDYGLVEMDIIGHNGGIISIKRTISGKRSEYFWNKECCSSKEYRKCLNNEGFHPFYRAYLIYQGDIGSIANMRPMELTNFFEDVSGSSQLKNEYEKAETSLQMIQNDVNDLEKQKIEICTRKREFKTQYNSLLEWRKLKDSIRDEKNYKICFELFQYVLDYNEIKKDYNEIINEKETLILSLNENNKAIEEYQNSISSIRSILNTKKEDIMNKESEKLKVLRSTKYFENKKAETSKRLNALIDQKKELKRLQKDDKKKESHIIQSINEFKTKYQLFIENNDILHQFYLSFFDQESSERLRESIQIIYQKREVNINNVEKLVKQINEIDKELESCQIDSNILLPAYPKQLDELKQELTVMKEKIDYSEKLMNNSRKNEKLNKRLKQTIHTVSVLKDQCCHVYGMLRDICSPVSIKYEKAINSCIGHFWNHIIVENEEMVCKCIEVSKSLLLGFHSFIPVQNIRAKPIKQSENPYLHSLLKYDPKFSQLIQYLCKNTIFIGSDQDAIDIWSKNPELRIVDSNGSIYQSNGVVVLHGNKNSKTNVKEYAHHNNIGELKHQQSEIEEKISEIEGKYLEAKKCYEVTLQNNRVLIDKQRELAIEKDLISQDILEKKGELKKIDDQISILKNEEENFLQKSNNSMIRITDSLVRIKELLGITDNLLLIQEYSKFREQEKSNERKLKELLKIQNNNHSIEISLITGEINRLKDTTCQLEKNQEENKIRIHNIENDIKIVANSISSANNEIKNINIKKKRYEKKNKTFLGKLAEIDTKIQKIESKLSEIESLIEELKTNSISMTNTNVFEHDFAILDTSEKKHYKLNERKRIIEAKEDSILKKTATLNEMKPNEESENKLSMIRNDKQEIDQTLKEKRKELIKCTNIFSCLKKDRISRFLKTFNQIEKNIQIMYSRLTSSKSHPVGGSAFLSLENPASPISAGIEFSVIPPLKRNQNITLLSGGEQTLAVLSLILAINRAIPGPCLILDEIDAALDIKNVNALKSFLKTESFNQQIILISHKEIVFSESNILFGICRSPKTGISEHFYCLLDENTNDNPQY